MCQLVRRGITQHLIQCSASLCPTTLDFVKRNTLDEGADCRGSEEGLAGPFRPQGYELRIGR